MNEDDFDIAIHVRIPRRRFKTLYLQAEKQHTTVAHLIRAVVITAIPETAGTPTVKQMSNEERNAYITRRNGEGVPDRQIARELKQSSGSVTRQRARLGLTAVRQVGGQHVEEASA